MGFRRHKTIISISFLILWLSLVQGADNRSPYWVYFKDKMVADPSSFRQDQHEFPHLTQRALDRRVRRGTIHGPTYLDLDVAQVYIDEIKDANIEIRAVSRWLNAVSVMATPADVEILASKSIVKQVKQIYPVTKKLVESRELMARGARADSSYGDSFGQNEQINAIAAHELGYTGKDMWLLMLDTGYYTDHLAFQRERIVAEYDFIKGDTVTQDQFGDASGQHNHGTATASAAGGYVEGVMRGVAYECQFLLAKTEILDQEIQVEEDFYVAGLEWGEALGADVVSSSLGYLDWYSYEDMDGATAITTRGVDIAASLGMVCVTAAGNEGSAGWYYIIAPADADSVISVGAVDISNNIASFSSHGPSYDGRIKPEVLAQGVGTFAAGTTSPTAYISASGTSLATPLVAGAAVLVLQANPHWTPMMVREALMMTADNRTTPDNTRGFGLIDVMAAINYDFGYTLGDISEDSSLDISDVVLLLEWTLDTPVLSDVQWNTADINDDNQLNVQDIVILVDWILNL